MEKAHVRVGPVGTVGTYLLAYDTCVHTVKSELGICTVRVDADTPGTLSKKLVGVTGRNVLRLTHSLTTVPGVCELWLTSHGLAIVGKKIQLSRLLSAVARAHDETTGVLLCGGLTPLDIAPTLYLPR